MSGLSLLTGIQVLARCIASLAELLALLDRSATPQQAFAALYDAHANLIRARELLIAQRAVERTGGP